MAQAITHIEMKIADKAEERTEALGQLLAAVADNREALLVLLDVLKELREVGLLDMLDAFLQNRERIGEIGITQLNQPGVHRMIKNGMSAVQFLGKIDPSMLENTLNAVASGLKAAESANKKNERVGLWGMMKTMRDPQVNASISMMLNFLRGMGAGLKAR